MATVPTGLQTCTKVPQMQHSGGGGTPWMQPKRNVTFKSASLRCIQVFNLQVLDLNIFVTVATVPTGLQELGKSAANAPFRGWGDTLDATTKIM